jgi:hypothetical protein|tara:strand:+ start:685 stop:1140 length:456 start_codon:yes stop_codon:yes gene_type:complete
MGWSTYFAFVLAAVNTLTVTYYLAIEKAPFLQEIFSSFLIYILFAVSIGIPLLIGIGYIHYKKSPSFTSESDITVESYPYYYKLTPGFDREVVFPLYMMMTKMMKTISSGEKFTDDELKEIDVLQDKIDLLLKGGMVGNFRRNDSNIDRKK